MEGTILGRPSCFVRRFGWDTLIPVAAKETPLHDFGLLTAYLVPGATVLFGLSPYSATLRSWFATTPADAPTIGGFLYLTLLSLAVGMTVSAVRWATIDTLHRYTGLALPPLDFSRLGKNVAAYTLLIDIHYKHYLHYANMATATAFTYISYRLNRGGFLPLGWLDFGFLALEVVFFAASRDTLRRYFSRTEQLLGQKTVGRNRSTRTQRGSSPRRSSRNQHRNRKNLAARKLLNLLMLATITPMSRGRFPLGLCCNSTGKPRHVIRE